LAHDRAALPPRPLPPLPVAVSDCLTGASVRYDGGHKREALCHSKLAGLFELRGICPELAIGMGVPRAPIRLVGDVSAPRARGVGDPRADVTDALRAFAQRTVPALADVCGYIFMQDSPSCGLHGVDVYGDANASPNHGGRGVFAAEIVSAMPDLPVEECGRLDDPAVRENFVTRVFAFAHWRAMAADGLTPARVIAFGSAYKYLLMAHSVAHYQQAGRLLADLSGRVRGSAGVLMRAEAYVRVLMDGLAQPATRGGHANVLQHLSGYVTRDLDAARRRQLADLIDSYRRGETPLATPLGLLRQHLQRGSHDYALGQIYLELIPPVAGTARELLSGMRDD
jgi:uncharacterized protein YbgA (DUF1722 family)/uncharacterized protein YbbK (DUF523 family)